MRLHATRRAAIAQGRGLGNPLWDLAGVPASLDQRFAESKSLVDAVSGQNLITFTRASDGTFVDSAGVIQTAAANVPRFDHNPVTGESLGLLGEEQRSNLLLNSGTLSTQSVTVTAVAHTLHFTGTGTITLTGASTAGPLVGTGTGEANRVSLTFTPTASSLTLTVSGTVTNAQLEIGAFRTSYIPTTATAVTRSADVASITGDNFSRWYRADEGTLFALASRPTSVTQNNRIAVTTDGTINNRAFDIRQDSSTAGFAISVTAGSGDMTLGIVYNGTNLPNKLAVAQGLNNANVAYNGTLGAGDTSVLMPSVNRLEIGSLMGGYYYGGHISRLTFFPQRLPNSTLQNITL